MAEDVATLAAEVDVVLVSLHKGVGHTPAVLAMYEGPVARAAVDAGAHAVFAHHAHIMRGVELYRGRPIYHGLGNFVTVTRALTPTAGDEGERAAWARRRVELYGFAPDPDMPYYPFHPESRNTAIAVCRFDRSGLVLGRSRALLDRRRRPAGAARERRGRTAGRVVHRAHHATGGPEDGISLGRGRGGAAWLNVRSPVVR